MEYRPVGDGSDGIVGEIGRLRPAGGHVKSEGAEDTEEENRKEEQEPFHDVLLGYPRASVHVKSLSFRRFSRSTVHGAMVSQKIEDELHTK
jgi:hypothetical protein